MSTHQMGYLEETIVPQSGLTKRSTKSSAASSDAIFGRRQ